MLLLALPPRLTALMGNGYEMMAGAMTRATDRKVALVQCGCPFHGIPWWFSRGSHLISDPVHTDIF